VRSALQCLQRPAIGWMSPPHNGHGTRASEGPGRAAAAMLPHAARRTPAMQSQPSPTAGEPALPSDEDALHCWRCQIGFRCLG
jgi:hypothetical protein